MAEVTIDQVPRKVRDLYNKAFSAIERNNIDYAIDMFLGVLDLEPRLLIARKYLRIAELKKFQSKKLNHSMSSLAGMGKTMSVKGALKKNPMKALRIVEDLMQKDPTNMQFVKLLDDAALAADMPEVAIQTYEMIREYNPEDVKLLKRLGRLYIDSGDPHNGRDCLEVVAKLCPTDQQAQKAVKDASALASMQKGNWEKEGSFRDKMKDSGEAQRLEQQSKAVKSSRELPALILEAQQKIDAEPENMNYRRALADLYGKDKNYERAIEVLEEAQRVSDSPDPQVDQAVTAYRVKQYEQEIAALRESGDEAGADAKAAEMEEYQFKHAQECVQRYPNDLQFCFIYGELLLQRDELNDAIQQFQKAQRNPQRRTRSLYYLALCFEKKGQLDIAFEQLEKAASELEIMDDSKKDVLYAMGQLCEQMDRQDDAVSYYKEIYAVDISYKDISDRIEKAYSKE